VPPPYVPQDGIIVIPPAGQEENSTFWGSALFTGILVLANLVALTVLGVMGYGLYRKKSGTQQEFEQQFEEQFEDDKEMGFESKDYY
jgi:heme/copper-type cytochrome/quinol oxidase subunit 2